MDIKMWCIGNEMDGPWQVGHMSPEEYAGAVDKVAHAMKLAESGLELVACGSSGAYMPTFGTWEKTVLTKAYENLDFVSCHAYYFDRGHKTRTAASMQDFLASSEDMTKFIATVSGRGRSGARSQQRHQRHRPVLRRMGRMVFGQVERAGRPVEGGGRAGFAPRAMA